MHQRSNTKRRAGDSGETSKADLVDVNSGHERRGAAALPLELLALLLLRRLFVVDRAGTNSSAAPALRQAADVTGKEHGDGRARRHVHARASKA